jgi:hypothetical protein
VNWKWKVNNKLGNAYGEVDPIKKVVWINLKEHEETDEPLVDTFIHEQLHLMFPEADEDDVERMTTAIIYFLSAEQLQELEAHYMAKLKEDARPISK